ncbi:hypothetical protein BOTBODRAFT_281888 [Botryobasidium botryosum FD-172 SS1]|uniref:Uncharacterized protein n=1 Tax=Botryobasidium botryosum (strain FD-172 SS1) TaxID=930990 RepID=A0A067MJ50_BOTB1|nr:hypothetical protein BOTBODRAFT_281888 [Botryobasidium botryosum FD-172 SS1]
MLVYRTRRFGTLSFGHWTIFRWCIMRNEGPNVRISMSASPYELWCLGICSIPISIPHIAIYRRSYPAYPHHGLSCAVDHISYLEMDSATGAPLCAQSTIAIFGRSAMASSKSVAINTFLPMGGGGRGGYGHGPTVRRDARMPKRHFHRAGNYLTPV